MQKVFIDLSESQQHHHHDMRLPSSAGDMRVGHDLAVSMLCVVVVGSGKRIPVTQAVDRGAVYLAQPADPPRGCC